MESIVFRRVPMSSYATVSLAQNKLRLPHALRLRRSRHAFEKRPARSHQLHRDSILKRSMDVALASFGLIVSLPVLAGLAIMVWLQSPGPVLYRSQRVGRYGKVFVCYKFRTMVVNADNRKDSLRSRNERMGATFKMANDPRVTRLGKFLRRYSLDELPQLWNVLRGEMSLVGPRPHPPDDVRRYENADLRRLRVTPGLTGLWQVTARRDPSFRRNIALDLEYIERRNLWMDLAILYKTIFAVLEGTGV
jgi:lipopolysaccharide/colanic/teichoic acid biosynthesis glycosyltransferase